MKRFPVILILFASLCAGMACHPAGDAKDEPAAEEKTEAGNTPVTVTSPIVGDMGDSVELNAVSSFLLRTTVKSSATGYLQLVNTALGKYVEKGQELFAVKTKEAQVLGNAINSLDTSLHFLGVIHIRAPGSGYISQLNYRAGDYVQDGEQLATITDTRSFVFLLELPYELRAYLASNKNLTLRLPDGTKLNGYIRSAMPTVDSASQTQKYIIGVNTNAAIPENLIAKVSLVKAVKAHTVSLPQAAILSNDIQTEFWIMKMIDSTRAVKVPVKKGMETKQLVEILQPPLSPSDRILITGNYGLPDTAKVVISQ